MKARNLIRTCQQQFQVEDRATQAAPPPPTSLPYALTVMMSPPCVSSVRARMKVGSNLGVILPELTGGSVKQLKAGSFKGVFSAPLRLPWRARRAASSTVSRAKALGNRLEKPRRRAQFELFRGSNMGEGSFTLRCVGRQVSPCIMIADQKPACALGSGACCGHAEVPAVLAHNCMRVSRMWRPMDQQVATSGERPCAGCVHRSARFLLCAPHSQALRAFFDHQGNGLSRSSIGISSLMTYPRCFLLHFNSFSHTHAKAHDCLLEIPKCAGLA